MEEGPPDGGIRTQIREIMTTNVITLRPENTIKDAVEKFGKNKIGGAPVIDDSGNLVGMVTDSDIFRHLRTKYKEFNIVVPSLQGMPIDFKGSNRYQEIVKAFKHVANTPVREVMRHKIIVMAPDELVEEAVPMMVDKRINRIPVVFSGKVVGILSRGDIIRALLLQILKEKVETGDLDSFGNSGEADKEKKPQHGGTDERKDKIAAPMHQKIPPVKPPSDEKKVTKKKTEPVKQDPSYG